MTTIVDVIEPAPRAAWREVVRGDPLALPTQSPEWLDARCRTGAYEDASRLYLAEDGTRAVLPLVRRRTLPRTWESFAEGWGFGGLIADGPMTPDLVGLVLDDVSRRRPLHVRLRPNPLQATAWAEASAGRDSCHRTPAHAHVLDLTGGFDEVWSRRFRSDTRRAVRVAERCGVTIETDTTGRLLPVFYELLARSVDRWARQQHEPLPLARYRFRRRDPLSKLQQIAARLGESCRVSVAWVEGEAAAGVLVLRTRNAHYTRGAMNEGLAGRTQANKLLHKVEIESACEAGCRSYHMGESRPGSGLARFKSQFGAASIDYASYRIEPLPWHSLDHGARRAVRSLVGFRDAP